MGNLTVITGMPGTRIRRSLAKFLEYNRTNGGASLRVFSIEEVLQEKARPLVSDLFAIRDATVVQTFLLPRVQIRQLWIESWSEVMSDVNSALTDSDVLLTFHLAYYHQLTREYFVAADIARLIADMGDRAKRVVTLLDDIFDCHESLIAGGSVSGMMDVPDSHERAALDLLQVLDWRSIEVMLSESLAASLRVPHFSFAVKHPMATFFDLLFSLKRVVYFSHPISEPRRLFMRGDEVGASAFVQEMLQIISRLQATFTVIEPTTIDELRFAGDSGNLSLRWPFRQDPRDLLYEPVDPCPPAAKAYAFPSGWSADERMPIPNNGLIQNLRDAVQNQIDARDHGLVEQSNIVAAYRPIYEGNASRGVKEELQYYGRLVSLNRRSADASIVYSPSVDRERYPRRRLAEDIIPGWYRQGFLEGTQETLQELCRRVLNQDDAQMQAMLNGEQDAFQRIIADCGLTIRPDENILPGGALGASVPTRRQAAAANLARQIQSTVNLYLDELDESGVIRVVDSEQMFYTALEN